jgi:hypothetical protein
MYGPAARRKTDFQDDEREVLHQCIRPHVWSILLWASTIGEHAANVDFPGQEIFNELPVLGIEPKKLIDAHRAGPCLVAIPAENQCPVSARRRASVASAARSSRS